MNQNKTDQEWQELQARIENRFKYFFKADVQRIEYKPLFTAPLLALPAAYNDNENKDLQR